MTARCAPLVTSISLAAAVVATLTLPAGGASSPGAAAAAIAPPDGTVFVNEIHYDNDGTDTGEAVEIAAPAGTDLAGWSIELYNGNGGASYGTLPLSGVVADQGGGFGTVSVTAVGLQNGSPDGLALVQGTTVAQFLSYEGPMTAADGPAAGLTSTDLPISEAGNAPVGTSLQLQGTGATYGAFTWTTGSASFGQVNAGQTFDSTTTPTTTTDPSATTTTTNPSTTTSPPTSTTTTTTLPPGPCPAPPTVTPIGTVQGATDISPCAGRTVVVDGVVVGDHEGPAPALRGFYIQEQDDQHDADPATSEGIFVFNGSDDEVALGDIVSVVGSVSEFQGQTQVTAQTITVTSSGAAVTAGTVALPVPATGHLERFEGMLVSFPQALTVTEHFLLGRFGQVTVAGEGGRLRQPTAVAEPGPAADAIAAANARNQLIVDDALQNQNPDPILFGRGGEPLSAANTLRGGDTVTGLVGVMTYTWGGNAASPNAYRVRPIGDLSDSGLVPGGAVPDFRPTNPRPVGPPAVGGALRVANFNVLNYFLTLDDGTVSCGPTGHEQECRGAETALELQRQRTKLLAALTRLDADIIGLIELENSEGVEPLADIVAGLNAISGPGTYDYIDTGTIGTDTIKVGLIYRPAVVSPLGAWAIIDSSVDPRFDSSRNRPSLAQSFETPGGEVLTIVVNHWKSKGCDDSATGDDLDLGSGQGCWTATRTSAAHAIVEWLATHPTGVDDDDFLLLGDLNSYAKEAPIDVLVDAGYVDLADAFGDPYSYVFNGQWGWLDYAMASPSLATQAVGAADDHINADEPSILDYNTNFKSPAQISSLYAPDEFRTSDHDPVISGFDLVAPLTVHDATLVLSRGGSTAVVSARVDAQLSACPALELRIDGTTVVRVTPTRVGRTTRCASLTGAGLVTFDYRTGAFTAAVKLPASFTLADDTVTFSLLVDGEEYVADVTGTRRGWVWRAG